MPDTPKPAAKTSSMGFLGRKLGPFPIIVWGAIGFGAYWWYTRRGPGARRASPAPARGGPVNVTIRETEPRGPRGPRGWPGRDKAPTRPAQGGQAREEGPVSVTGRPFTAPARGPAPPVPRPAAVAAPMTAGDVYGDLPVASPDGSTYDSGDAVEAMGAAYAVAG